MTVETDIKNLGVPDLKISGLQVWTHSRKYPESKNFWDVNWLNTTFVCKGQNALVWVSGDILHNTEIAEWLTSLENLNSTLSGEVILPTLERYVSLKITTETYERISIKVDISPSRVFQQHYFEFWTSQNYLNDIIAGCRGVLARFPVKGDKPL